MTANSNSTKTSRRFLTPFFKGIKWAWLVMTIVTALLTIISANSGLFNPENFPLPSLLAMAFPGLIIFNVIFGIINIFINRWGALVQWVALICSISAIANWFPVHPLASTPGFGSNDKLIRFMSFNTYGFVDNEEIYPDSTNRSATAIIKSKADIICLQEVGRLFDLPLRFLTDQQIDSINNIYPYFASEDEKLVSILSKYPLKEISLQQPPSPHSGWQAAEVYIGNDTILVVSVHLQSFGLDDSDKVLFHKITDGDVSTNMTDAGKIILRKLVNAFRLRAKQAQLLRHQLDSLNYKNIILSGDFNDISNCYPIRTISGDKMKSVYSEIATGPIITYHRDRFFFNIDHTLYQGKNLVPIRYRRGNIKCSDHYPVFVTFKLDN